jgi:hypothetical protein
VNNIISIPWTGVLKKLSVIQLAKMFSGFYGIQSFISVHKCLPFFYTPRQLHASISLIFMIILILLSHLRSVLCYWSLLCRILIKSSVGISRLPV